jgi:hypothetical protein
MFVHQFRERQRRGPFALIWFALSWFGVVVWWVVEDMVGKEKPSSYVEQKIWRELVASIMLSVCIAVWVIDMPMQEKAAEQACGNNVEEKEQIAEALGHQNAPANAADSDSRASQNLTGAHCGR